MITIKSPRHVSAGSRGGRRRAANLTAEERSDQARAAAKARWANRTPAWVQRERDELARLAALTTKAGDA